jgi:hypothetical protein
MRFSWDENKRRSNLRDHGLDFVDAPGVFDGPAFTFEYGRLPCGEQRFVKLGFLADIAVSIVHAETPSRIHVISFRKAPRHEEVLLLQNLQN